MFKTSAQVAKKSLPAWLQADLTLEKQVPIPSETDTAQRYKRTTFDQVFNYMMRGTIRKWIADKPDPFVVADDIYFDGSKTQTIIRPTYYKVPSVELSNRRSIQSSEGFANEKEIKCYPLDLHRDVRDNKVILDESKNA